MLHCIPDNKYNSLRAKLESATEHFFYSRIISRKFKNSMERYDRRSFDEALNKSSGEGSLSNKPATKRSKAPYSPIPMVIMNIWNNTSLPALQHLDSMQPQIHPNHLSKKENQKHQVDGKSAAAIKHVTSSERALTSVTATLEKAGVDGNTTSTLRCVNLEIHSLCPRCKNSSPSSPVVSHPLQCADSSSTAFKIGYTTVRCTHCEIDHTECINNPEHGHLVWQKETNTKNWLLKCPKCAKKRSRSGHSERGEWTRCEHPKCLGLYRNCQGSRSVARHKQKMRERHTQTIQPSEGDIFSCSTRSSIGSSLQRSSRKPFLAEQMIPGAHSPAN